MDVNVLLAEKNSELSGIFKCTNFKFVLLSLNRQLTVHSSHPNFSQDSAPDNKQNFSKHKCSTQPQLATAFNRVRS